MRPSLLLLALAALALAACSGDTGPAGPTGPEGPQGPAGGPGSVESFFLVEHAVDAGDYTTATGLLLFDARITLDGYVDTYVAIDDLPVPAYVTLEIFGDSELEAEQARPYAAVFDGGLVIVDSDRVLLGRTLLVAVLPR